MSAATDRLLKAATVASTSVAVLMVAGKLAAWLATGAMSMPQSSITR